MRLIDAEALKTKFEKLKKEADTLRDALYLDGVLAVIDTAPTIEAKPIVNGKWEVVSTETYKWVNKCSACGGYLKRGYKQTNYCPNCGANMFKKEGE